MITFTQKLGTTRSSKPILQPLNTDTETLTEITVAYTLGDHFDAYALFQYLLSRELSTLGRDSPRLRVYNAIGNFHSDRLGAKEIGSQMDTLALATIFDVVEFGKSIADSIFP